MTTDRFHITDEGTERKFFSIIPHFVDDMGLSPYAVRLYLRFKRRAGESPGGVCRESTKNLASACKMSKAQVSRCKKELVEAGLITITKGAFSKGRYPPDRIRIIDIWSENMKQYSKPDSSRNNSSDKTETNNSSCSLVSHRNNSRFTQERALPLRDCDRSLGSTEEKSVKEKDTEEKAGEENAKKPAAAITNNYDNKNLDIKDYRKYKEIYCNVTGNLALPVEKKDISIIIDTIANIHSVKKENTQDYLKPFYDAWIGRGYNKIYHGWLDWASSGEIPKLPKKKHEIKAPEPIKIYE